MSITGGVRLGAEDLIKGASLSPGFGRETAAILGARGHGLPLAERLDSDAIEAEVGRFLAACDRAYEDLDRLRAQHHPRGAAAVASVAPRQLGPRRHEVRRVDARTTDA
jgi:hypothetical protein